MAITKKEAVDAAIKLLHNIYAEHIDAIAALMSAQDAYLERGDTSEIVDALCGVREFVDDLIKAIKEG